MDSGKSDYVPRRPTPIGDPNNLLDNDSIGLDESEIKRNMLTNYPINKDTSEAKSTTDPVVKQAPFAPRRPTPIGDLNFLLDKRKKKYKTNPTFMKLFNELEGKGKVNEVTPVARSKKRSRSPYSDESYREIEGIDSAELNRLDRMVWEESNALINYEYVNDLHASMMEELDNAFIVMVEYQKKKDLFKQFLDAKYRKL